MCSTYKKGFFGNLLLLFEKSQRKLKFVILVADTYTLDFINLIYIYTLIYLHEGHINKMARVVTARDSSSAWMPNIKVL